MKKGFTLIELLTVIVILAIIALIAVPIVVNIINDAKKSSHEESLKMYGKAIEDGIANYLLKNPNDKEITLDKIKNHINYSGEKIECGIVQIGEKGEIYLSDCAVGSTKVEYEYGKQLYMIIDLPTRLVPVIYDGNNWKITTSSDKNWYDYNNQKWANAVVLKANSAKKIGDVVTVEETLDDENNLVEPDVLMMYVWIPRYEYKIEGTYGKHTDGTDGTQALPGEIKVNFIGKNITTPTTGYHIHPAFTFGEKKENGFWVGKFEISHTTKSKGDSDLDSSAKLNCNTETCNEAQNLRIIPNVPSLRYNNVSNYWYVIKSIENTNSFGFSNLDIHMMKNSEWGAVAYLSQSKYGKYGNKEYEGDKKEVYINNSSGYYTGRSGGNPGGSTPINGTYTDQISTDQYNTYGFYTYDGYLLSYNTNIKTEIRDINKGTGSSTTGNIYGVYDMSGGAFEYVIGAYGTAADGLGLQDSKYYELYANATNVSSNDGKLSCKNGNEYGICYGHSISETSNWYGDYAYMVNSNNPWFVRGGSCSRNTSAGVFSRGINYGNGSYYVSTRIVVFAK